MRNRTLRACLEANPWVGLADCLEAVPPGQPMTLPGDAATVAAERYNATQRSDKSKFHLELFPQPFIGTPDASHWIVGLNPGYVPEDAVEQLGADWPGAYPDAREGLSRRRTLLVQALRLAPSAGFYPFDASFRIFQRFAHAVGTQNWWLNAAIGTGASPKFIHVKGATEQKRLEQAYDVASRELFNVELFPYHAFSFGLRTEDYAESAHVRFVLDLLVWGAANGKHILVRCPGKLMELADRVGVRLPVEQLFAVANSRRFFLSSGNVARFTQPTLATQEAAQAFWNFQ